MNTGIINSNSLLTITTTGNDAFGANAESGGQISIYQGSSIVTSGVQSRALRADNGIVTFHGGTITTTGNGGTGAWAVNGGIITILNGTQISTAGVLAYGLQAFSGSTISMNGGSVKTVANNTLGVSAEGADAIITLDGVTITTEGTGADALYALNGGSITGDDLTIHTTLTGSYGAYASSDALITLNRATIRTDGDNSKGLYALSRSVITVDGGTITTTDHDSAGVEAQIDSVIILTNGVVITTEGYGSAGLSTSSGTITMDGGSITTRADVSPGADAWSGDALIILNGVAVTTEGDFSRGLDASSTGIIRAEGSTVRTTGEWADGASSANAGTLISLTSGTQISTEGDNSAGLAAYVSGGITMDRGSVGTSGDNSAAIFLSGSGTVNVNQSTLSTTGANAHLVHAYELGDNAVNISNSTLTAVDGVGFKVTDVDWLAPSLLATVVNSTVTAGDELINVNNRSTLNLNATGSTFTGSAMTATGGISNVNLQSTNWTVTGDSNVTSLTNGAGSLVHFTPPGSSAGPFKTLTAVNYIGQGGTLGINTVLGGDGSPSGTLVIDGGAATGTSQLAVNNVGGGGALTALNGILVVDAIGGGTTVPGLFALAAPVVAGPYEYMLYRGSVDASNPDAWYLRSVLDCALDPSASVCGGGGGDIPIYRPETSLYAAVPAMTLLYGRLMLDTLHERRGTAVSSYAEGAPNAAWARVIGQHGDRDGGKGGIYGAGPKYDYDFWAFQGGMDLYRDGDVGTSRNHAGAFFAIGHGSGDVQHIGDGKAGENSFMAYSWGAYWTHYTPENAYVDALLLGSWYDIDAKSNRIDKLTTNGAA
ncbi:autotransporter outer membrane beta-barrel domain-containing protein, partial [Hyphomicrobium sulfonivorans]|uniref:autotransporter outer membrane beta-barrel domain-containing protein n=1 Tax=Hyphomicrobium sulfonivorans TaxID=121290 RepID=UPI001AEBC64E